MLKSYRVGGVFASTPLLHHSTSVLVHNTPVQQQRPADDSELVSTTRRDGNRNKPHSTDHSAPEQLSDLLLYCFNITSCSILLYFTEHDLLLINDHV